MQNEWGKKLLVKGEKTFFLMPGEALEHGIESVLVLGQDESLLVIAQENYKDEDGKVRQAGEKWMIKGPREYVIPVELKRLDLVRTIPLDKNEGIYIRNNDTGEVVSVKGQTYMLRANESLWEKEVPEQVEKLLGAAATGQPYCAPKVNEKG